MIFNIGNAGALLIGGNMQIYLHKIDFYI